MATQLVVKREELKARQAALAAIFEQAGPDLDLGKAEALKGLADTKARADEVRRMNDELTALGMEVERLAETERIAASVKGLSQEMQHPAKQPETKGVEQSKNLGEMFVESVAFKSFDGRRSPAALLPGVDIKTLMTQAAGWAPENIRMPGYVPSAQRIPTVLDAIPMGTTGQAAVVYMEETTYTNNAAGRTEGANNAGEAALALTVQTANVREFAVWLPVTREQMDDVAQVQGYVNNRLPLMLRQVITSRPVRVREAWSRRTSIE